MNFNASQKWNSVLLGTLGLFALLIQAANPPVAAEQAAQPVNSITKQRNENPSTASEKQDGKEGDKQDTKKTEAAKQEKPLPPFTVSVAKDAMEFSVTGTWKKIPPKSNMIEAEIKIPKQAGDDEDGRLTIMGAGGTVEANIIRWQGQFLAEDGEPVEAKTEVKTIADQTVHIVDISGTYLDTPGGPFAGGQTVEREDYRMLAAIVQTKTHGNYFVKLYGPKKTIEQNAEHFKAMINSLKVNPPADKAKMP